MNSDHQIIDRAMSIETKLLRASINMSAQTTYINTQRQQMHKKIQLPIWEGNAKN